MSIGDQLPFGRRIALRALTPRGLKIKSQEGWNMDHYYLQRERRSFNNCCWLLVCSRAFGRVFPLPVCCPLTLGAPRPSMSISCCPNPWAGLLSWILQERSLSEKVLQECQYCSLSWKERSPFDRWGSLAVSSASTNAGRHTITQKGINVVIQVALHGVSAPSEVKGFYSLKPTK